MTTAYRPLINVMATRYRLDADALEAQVVVESSGNADAFRYEAGIWQQLCRGALKPAVPIDVLTANPRRVASSYGLLQILYITALDRGYRGDPEGLFVPEVGLSFGCAELARLLTWSRGDLSAALAAYNGGIGGNAPSVVKKRNQAYVDRVYAAKAALLKARQPA